MIHREMAETTRDHLHLSLRDVESAPTRTPDLLHAHHQGVVVHQLEVRHADAEEVRAIAHTAATVEAGLPQEVAVPAERATAAEDSLQAAL